MEMKIENTFPLLSNNKTTILHTQIYKHMLKLVYSLYEHNLNSIIINKLFIINSNIIFIRINMKLCVEALALSYDIVIVSIERI